MPSQSAPWRVYREALTPLKFGDALWEPGPIPSYRRVRLGDVGYIRRGRFHLLFSAGIPLGSRVLGTDAPLTFEPLDIGLVIPGEVRSPGYLRTQTVQQIGMDVGGSVAVACPVEPGARIAFELTSKQGAALITNRSTYREDIEKERRFVNYIKRHYKSWVDFARESDHGENIRPVLVTGVDLTREFATIAYSDNQTHMECEFSAGVPAVASTSASVWGSWRTQGLVHTNCGPHPSRIRRSQNLTESSSLESEIPDEYNHCVFVRYYTIRRWGFIPRVLKAGAGPHQLPEESPEDDTVGEVAVAISDSDSDDDSTGVDYPEISPGVTHNVPLDDRDGFDVVAEFILQRSDATSVLLHHDDIQDLLRGSEEETIQFLEESAVVERVEIDENGVGQLAGPSVNWLSELVQENFNIADETPGQTRPGQASTMIASTKQQIRQGVLLSSLDEAIEAIDLATVASSTTPIKTVFSSVSVLLTTIKDSATNKIDYIELGLTCANTCRALDRGMSGKEPDGFGQSVFDAIQYLSMIVAEIQGKVTKQGGWNTASPSLHAKDEEAIAAWELDLSRITFVFNAELAVDARGAFSDISSFAIPKVSTGPKTKLLPYTTSTGTRRQTHTTAIARPRRSALAHLSRISRDTVSSQEAQQVLTAAFTAPDYIGCIRNLKRCRIDPQAYIDGLDRIIDTLTPGSEIYNRSLRALRKACGIYGILPSSHLIPPALTLVTAGTIKRPFASGGFSDMWKARNNSGQVFAIKHLRTYEVDNLSHVKKKYCKEVIICKRIRHENILSVEGVAPELFEFCVVSRWMDNGNMLHYVRSQGQVDRKSLLLGVTRGLDYLHSNGIIHGDLKGSNVLIDEKGKPLLADFGLSSIMEGATSISASTPASGGTIRWSSPELLGASSDKPKDRTPTTKSDVYALSMVIIELYTGNVPFVNVQDPTVIVMVARGERPPKPVHAEVLGLTPAVWELTKMCWHEKPAKRPDVSEILVHFEGKKAIPQPPFLERLKGTFAH